MTDPQPGPAPEQPRPVPGRARRRAVRAYAARSSVPYSVAARQLDAVVAAGGRTLASHGRTVYPTGTDTHRLALVEDRDRRSGPARVQDARLAATLPAGRARHLSERFPPTRGEPGTGVGPLYAGAGRVDTLSLLYTVLAQEAPGLLPSAGDLAWAAEMGEETAIDMLCGDLDRAARLLLDGDRMGLHRRVREALAATQAHRTWQVRADATRLAGAYRLAMNPSDGPDGLPVIDGLALDGAQHILDAVLIVGDDGHAPGTRVRMLAQGRPGRTATIVGVRWAGGGPPVGYRVQPDGARRTVALDPQELVVLDTGRPR